MEIRASYLLVGTVVLVLIAGLAAFSVWLVNADIDREVEPYRIAFAGSVTGLQEGSQVRYRGVPIGRVTDIRIDPERVEWVLVEIEVDRGTPIKQDTVASLEMQGITGIAYVQLRGGTQDSAVLEATGAEPVPEIPSRRSTIERLFESTPELLARSVALVDQATLLLSDQNVQALTKTLQNLETVTASLAKHGEDVDGVLSEAQGVAQGVGGLVEELGALATDLRELSAKADVQMDGVGTALSATLADTRQAANTLGRASTSVDELAGQLRQPLGDFAATGLYELTQLVGETRQLIATLTRITKEFERDPAGFFIGGDQRGFKAE
jgi:phospholipid/cholesterol/gamma-HCH transport system substrate-binding protein